MFSFIILLAVPEITRKSRCKHTSSI